MTFKLVFINFSLIFCSAIFLFKGCLTINDESERKRFEESKRNRNEIMKRMPDIEKARIKLDYDPVISLEEGIMKVIKKVNSN